MKIHDEDLLMMMSEMMKTFSGGKLFKHRPRGRDLSLEPQSKSVGAHFGHWLTEIQRGFAVRRQDCGDDDEHDDDSHGMERRVAEEERHLKRFTMLIRDKNRNKLDKKVREMFCETFLFYNMCET